MPSNSDPLSGARPKAVPSDDESEREVKSVASPFDFDRRWAPVEEAAKWLVLELLLGLYSHWRREEFRAEVDPAKSVAFSGNRPEAELVFENLDESEAEFVPAKPEMWRTPIRSRSAARG